MITHLKEVNMSYFVHCWRSIKFGLWALRLSVVCVVHAIFPWVFTDTFSTNLLQLAKQLEEEK